MDSLRTSSPVPTTAGCEPMAQHLPLDCQLVLLPSHPVPVPLMALATLALVLLAPSPIPAQLPVGPLFGPGGGSLKIVDIELSGTEHWLLGIERSGTIGDEQTVVARIDGSGVLSWLPPIPDSLIPDHSEIYLKAVGENQVLVRGRGNAYRTLSVSPQGWQEQLMFTPTTPGGTYAFVNGDISGSTIVFSHPGYFPQPLVFDPTLSVERGELPTMPGWIIPKVAVDGDTAIAHEFLGPLQRLSVFRSVGGVWTRAGEIESPNGIGWRRGGINFEFDNGVVAVSAATISPQDPCPKLYFFEEDPSGDFALAAEFEAASPCATSETIGVGYSRIRLVGSELAAVENFDGRADRFERTAQGWVRRERVAGAGGIQTAWPINGQLVSASSEVFAPLDSPGGVQITCATPAPVFSRLARSGGSQTSAEPVLLGWTVDSAPTGTPYFLAVGFQPGSRPLGATAELCMGGPVSVVPMSFFGPEFGKDSAWVTIDPIGAGLPPGGTLYVQAWRPDSSTPGGLTSNGLSILFAP